ncbi:hypothetical protein E4U59_005672 [Claviceps monticola]|nr:hypothetical protein E4U59_005672 [Claviceps monticola]
MHFSSILPLAAAALGVANAQYVTYTGGDGYETLVGIGYRCYEYTGQVYHVDAQPGVQAIFYNGPYCRGSREISAWGSSNLESPFWFQSVLLRPF